MKPNLSKIIFNTIITTIFITLTACGGGGASDSSSSSSGGGSTYTGSTTQATITAENADDFALPILEGGISTSGISPYDTATRPSSSKKEQRAAIMTILADQAKNQVLNTISNKDTITPAASTSIDGSCGGTYVTADNSNYSQTSGTVDISFTYTNYCNGTSNYQTTQNGSISITGNFTVSNGETIFSTFTLTITDMSLTVVTNSGSTTESFSGVMTMTFVDGKIANGVVSITIDMVFVGANGLTFKVENYVIDRSSNMLTIDGRFYHPINGYVVVTTTEPFDLIPGSSPEQYCSGSMQVSGSGGVVDFTADATCSNYELCYTPTDGTPSCSNKAWP